jgi:alpha-D-xyloside xylohydrolase
MVTRREILALAGAAPAMLLSTPAATEAQPQAPAQAELEQHEFVQAISSFDKTNTGVVFHCKTNQGTSVDVTLTVCTSEIVRLQMCPDPELKNVKGLLEIKEDWPPFAFNLIEKPESVSVDTGSLRIEFQKSPWKYSVYDKQGQIVLQEHVKDVDTQGNFRGLPMGFTTVGGKFRRSNETFALAQDENFYGFGERFTKLNKLGLKVNGWVVNPWGAGTDDTHKPIPFFMSTGGYGIFANTTFRTRCDMGSRSVVSYTFLIDDPRLDYFIIYGPSLKQVLARYEEITGWPAFPPKESFGVWFQINGRVTGENGPLAVAKKFRDLGLPMDFFTSVVALESTNLQDGLALIRQLSPQLGKLNIKIGIHVAPFLRSDSEMGLEAKANGFALMRKDGSPYEAILVRSSAAPTTPSHIKVEENLDAVERGDVWRDRFYAANRFASVAPDFTNPAAVKWWKDKVGEYMKAGCSAVGMSDFGEDNPADAYYHNGRNGLEMHNLYTLLYHKATFEAVQQHTDHRALINARSGTAGMQKYPICWSGDPECEWEEMASTLRGGLSLGLCGVPFWSNDVGGYLPIDELSPEHPGPSAELYIRWMQMSMFQSHTRFNGAPLRAPWTYGNRAVENYRKYATLRYRLLPYIYSHAYNATKTGLPMMRAMVLEFQDDPSTHNLQDQYMFGDAFLVAPVHKPVNKRTVYLPAGKWYDYETGKEYTGPNTFHVEPPLEVLPVYVRENSIIPMGPEMVFVGEKSFNPITLDVWLSSEAECVLYDDDERAHTEEIVNCQASKKANQIVLKMGASGKTYIAKFNKTSRPKNVSLNGKDVPHLASVQALDGAELGWYFDRSSLVYAKFNLSGKAGDLVLRW